MLLPFRNGWRGALVLTGALAIALPWAAPVFAQARDTGTMSVRTVDPDGQPVPGVMVVAAGPVGTRTQYTGVDGTARFPGLMPGDYTATFSLAGFNTVVRESLRIAVGRTISVEVEMRLSSVEETITVTGESPIVDVKTTSVGSLYTDELIDMAPTASGIWAGVLDHVPGIVQDNFDVGGGASGSQSLPSAYGSDWSQNVYNVNGANANDPSAIGATVYFNTAAFEEVGVATGGHDVESQSPGVMINMVVKSGSNDWHGGAKFFYENDSFVSNNVKTEELRDAVGEGNPNTFLGDLTLQIGGPVVRNRAWFFVDYWDFETRRILIGVPEEDKVTLTDWTASGTYQLNDNHKLTGRYLTNRKFYPNRGANRNNPFFGFIQDFFSDLPQIQWQGVFGGNAFADVRFSKFDIDFPQTSRTPGSKNPLPGFIDEPQAYDYATDNNVQRPTWRASDILDLRDTATLQGTVSYYITGENSSHDMKFGGEFGRQQRFVPNFRAHGYRPRWEDYEAGITENVTLYASPFVDLGPAITGKSEDVLSTVAEPNSRLTKSENFAFFLQDTWTIANRLTLTGAVRYDDRRSWNPAQARAESYWPQLGPNFQAAQIAAQDDAVHFRNLVPRIGVVYDLRGDGRWALKFNFSQYSEQFGTDFGSGTLNQNGQASRRYDWTDLNGDGLFQFGEQGALIDESIPGVTSAIDADLESPISSEFSGGVEHELFDNFLVSGRVIYRTRSNDIDDVNIGRPYATILGSSGCNALCQTTVDPYVPVTVTDPGPDGQLGTADDGGQLTVWARDRALSNNSFYILTNSDRFGLDAVSDYRGLELVFQKRWSNNWQFLGSYNVGRAEATGDLGDNPNSDFNNRKQATSTDRTHMIKFTGNYLFDQPIGINIGVYYRMVGGQPERRRYTYSGSFLTAASGVPRQSSTTINVAAHGEDDGLSKHREDTTHIVDLRAEKQIAFGSFGVAHVYADIFNLFNVNTTTSFDDRSGPNYLNIFNIVPPRVFRIGASWDF